MTKNIAFLFPGQGAQYPGMGKDFYDNFTEASDIFHEAEEILERKITDVIFNGPASELTKTHNSQIGIFVVSMAILKVLQVHYPEFKPTFTAGLSLGEYSAATAAGIISFTDCLPLVQYRGRYMSEACEKTDGTMAVVMGLDAEAVKKIVKEVNLPNDLWTANFNCPGQVVISGTKKGVDAGIAAAKNKGAKGVIPLQVHGAFHSGLMKSAEEKLDPIVHQVIMKESPIKLVMNVSAQTPKSLDEIVRNLILQVTNSVLWEQSINTIVDGGADLFVEIGCGKALSGFNKRIGVLSPTISIEKVEDLKKLEALVK